MRGLYFGEVHVPANSLKDGAAQMAGGGQGNVGGTRGVVDLTIGAADHDDVFGGFPAHLGLQMVVAWGQNLASHSEGERHLKGELSTRADRDSRERGTERPWKGQGVFLRVFHKLSC